MIKYICSTGSSITQREKDIPMKNILYTNRWRKRMKKNTYNALLLSLNYFPLLSGTILVIAFLQGILPLLRAVVIANFLNSVMDIVSYNGEKIYTTAIVQAFYLAVIIVLEKFVRIVKELLSKKLELGLMSTVRYNITEKCAKIKYEYYEKSEILDVISRITETPEKKIREGFFSYMNFFVLLLQLIGLEVMIIPSSLGTAVLLFLMCIPLVLLALFSGKAIYKSKVETRRMHRQYEYFEQIMSDRETVLERNIFGFGKRLSNYWHQVYEKVRKIELKTEAIWYVRTKMNGIVTVSIMVVIIISLINPFVSGLITVGLFISVINAIYSLVDKIAWTLAPCIEAIVNVNQYSKELKIFFELEECKKESCHKVAEGGKNIVFQSLVFEHVSFCYPGTSKYILKDFSYEIESGKHYALVGINGAGKTTLVKLLLGLYDNYEGKILINNIDKKEFSHKQLKGLISVIYQDFVRYNLSIKENILIGGMNNCAEISEQKIDDLLQSVGLKEEVELLPQAKETMLGKIYENGLDMSGGQWQRLALARMIASDSSILVMDEPTSALDPMNESKFYKDFFKLSASRTTIVISHRLGAAVLADKVLLLRDGKVTETGSHRELLDKRGEYAEMYQSQKRWYGETGE